jgi:transcriptional regulator with XRE-family HTH domain
VTALQALKLESRLSYQEIADAVGLSKGQVSNLIRGRRTNPEHIQRIRVFLRGQVKPQSSDPEFLAQIRQIAVPFLRSDKNVGAVREPPAQPQTRVLVGV